MSEHYTSSTETVTAWCNKCQRVTDHEVSANRRGRCKENHGPETTTCWCPSCKSGTLHRYQDNGKAICTACDSKRTAQSQSTITFDDVTTRHIAALDGMGNRGEK